MSVGSLKRWNWYCTRKPYWHITFNEGWGPFTFTIIERWWNGRSASKKGGWFIYVGLFGFRWHT